MRAICLALLISLPVVACEDELNSEWETLSSLAVARSEHPAVVWQGQVVVAGGLIVDGSGRVGVTDSVEALDPASGEWSALPSVPAPRHHSMAAAVGDRLFIIGGYSAGGFDATSEVWELEEGEWTERSSLPSPVAAGGAAVVGGHIYVVGGAPDARSFRYDVATDRWEDIASTEFPREHLAVTESSGQIWALGGRWGPVMYDTIEIYDTDSGTWFEGPTMQEARSGFGAAFIGDVLYVAGGEVFGPDRTLGSIEMLAPGAESWMSAGVLPEPLHGIPLVSAGGDLLVIGGSTRAGAVDNPGTVWSIDPLRLGSGGG